MESLNVENQVNVESSAYAEFSRFLEPVKREFIGFFMSVLRTDTGRVAEKAKVCWENPV